MELIKENIKVNEAVVSSSTKKMVEGDIIVPDTKPDILKVLQVDAVSCVTDKELSAGSAAVKGRVDLKILYIPDSENENIKNILHSLEFDEDISNKQIEEEDFALIGVNVERVEFSLINSRKLRIKVIVVLDYEIVRTVPIELAVDTEGEAQIKRRTVTLQNSAGVSEFSFLIRDRLSVPAGQGAFKELLKADYRICDTEYKTVTGRITAKGSIGVCLLYTDVSGNIEFCEGELPFTEVWEMDDVTEDCECDIEYQLDEGEVMLEEDTDGDLREAAVSVNITAQVKASETLEVDMIEDCFIPYKKTLTQTEEIMLEETAAHPSAQSTIREIIEIPDGAPEISSVYNVVTHPYISKAGMERNKLICEGRIEACVLYVSDSMENPVYSVKKNLPFSVSLDCDNAEGDVIPKLRAEVRHTGYNLNASGEVELRCILSLSANVVRQRRLDLITELDSEDYGSEPQSRIVVYFVQSGDSLWEVSKRYRVPCNAISEYNELNDDKLKPGMRLLIPGK
ncbi:MAG: DUF3794 domain-containing protein [Clostridia bacterium]|nr:DUF3794 domain-containing protein [Clostridia bacterium]